MAIARYYARPFETPKRWVFGVDSCMKKFLLILFAITVFFSCSKDDDESLVSSEDIEIYEKTFVDVYDFLDETMSIDLPSFVDYANMLDGVTKVSTEDSIVYITTKGNVDFTIDFNTYPDYEAGHLDLNDLQSYIDSINHATDNVAINGYEQTSEIFKEFIKSHNLNNVDDGDNSVTRTSSETPVRLVRRNFVIWSPYTRDDFVKEKEDIRTIVRKKTDLCSKTIKFTPSSFTALGKFDVVYFASHGSRNGSFFLPKECLSSDDIKEYENEIKEKRVENSIRKIDGKKVIGYTLKESFFDKYLPNLSHTILYTNACHFGSEKSLFMKCAKKKNVADYFGADDVCFGSHIFDAFKEFYPKLMNGSSSKMAFNNGKRSFYRNKMKGKVLESFNYKRFGTKNVSYVIPRSTGVGNRTGTNRALTRSNEAGSSIIVNTQLRYSSEESGDILQSIEAGICLQDMDTKEVKLIPFTSNNIVSNEKKTYGDVTVSNIAASLDDLVEGHQYAYCCYTKVDGAITLSDECYKIDQNYLVKVKYKWHNESLYKYYCAWYKDGRQSDGGHYDTPFIDDFESEFLIYIIDNQFYIGLAGLPNQLYANNTNMEYNDFYYGINGDYYDKSGTAICNLKNDNIHIKWSYSLKEPYEGYLAKGYVVHSEENEIDIQNIGSSPFVSWKDEKSITEWFYNSYAYETDMRENLQRWTHTNVLTYIGFEKLEIPDEVLKDGVPNSFCKIIKIE